MNLDISRVLGIVTLILLIIPALAFGGGRVPEMMTSSRTVSRQIQDEADPSDTQACFALGQLDISFRTGGKGSPTVGIVMTDPRGRRIGFDPIKKRAWQDLPQAEGFIDCDAPDDQGSCHGSIQICGPLSGTYRLEIIAQQSGEYNVDVSGRSAEIRDQHGLNSSRSVAEVHNVNIHKGSRDLLLLDYSRDFESKVAFQPQPTLPISGGE